MSAAEPPSGPTPQPEPAALPELSPAATAPVAPELPTPAPPAPTPLAAPPPQPLSAWGPEGALGLAWLVLGLLEVSQRGLILGDRDVAAGLVMAVAMAAAVGLHRLRPALALGLVWGACVIQVTFGLDVLLVQLGVAFVAYGTARYGSASTVWISGVSVPVAGLVGSLYLARQGVPVPDLVLGRDPGRFVPWIGPTLLLLVAATTVVALPWMLGLLLRTRDRLVVGRREQADTERLRALAEEQRLHAEEVSRVREQQARLACDVHDVVGHSLAVIVAQAESAQYLPDDPARLKETFAAIAGVARVSLRDVRRVLSTAPDDAPAPPPGGLDDLVEGVRASGTLVRDVQSGTPVDLPPDLALVAYRVLQEMLTNAIKHGVPGEPVTVNRLWQSDGLLVEVSNRRASATSGRGGGVEGMLRRVAGVRGSLRVLEDETTFVARAWLPLGEQAQGPGGP
ncbi:MAG: histidine kinase [Kineosporiaceae bacterium]